MAYTHRMEPPDFAQITRQFFIDYRGDPLAAFADQLRQVWNARGVADREAVTQESERIAIKELDR